jgi:hypothetical protein
VWRVPNRRPVQGTESARGACMEAKENYDVIVAGAAGEHIVGRIA